MAGLFVVARKRDRLVVYARAHLRRRTLSRGSVYVTAHGFELGGLRIVLTELRKHVEVLVQLHGVVHDFRENWNQLGHVLRDLLVVFVRRHL